MASALLTRRFSEMSTDRDKVEESVTEAKGYQTEEGFVQEVVSTAPARISGVNGEVVQVVTRRKTVTTLGPDGSADGPYGAMPNTAPRLNYAGSEAASGAASRTASVGAFGSPARGPNNPNNTSVGGGGVGVGGQWEHANTEYSRTSSYGAQPSASGAGGNDALYPAFYQGARAAPTPGGAGGNSGASPAARAPAYQQPAGSSTYQPLTTNGINTTPSPRNNATANRMPSAMRTTGRPYGSGRFVQLYASPPAASNGYGVGGVGAPTDGGLGANDGVSPIRRYVRINDTYDTREVEPYRMSPIKVQPGYAPVKYVTRADLRRMREEQAFGPPMGPRSSVSQWPSNTFNNYDVSSSGGGGGGGYGPSNNANGAYDSPSSQYPTRWGGRGDGEDYYDDEAPMPAGRHMPIRMEDDLESIASSAHGQYRRDQARMRQQQGEASGTSPQYPSYPQGGGGRMARDDVMYGRGGGMQRYRSPSDRRGYASGGGGSPYANGNSSVRRTNSSGPIGYNRLGVMRDSASLTNAGAPVPYTAQPQYRTELRDLLAVDLDVFDVADYLAATRQIPTTPRPPDQASQAFMVVTRGTYLVKYGRSGKPHERFVALRMIPDEVTGRTHPYLVWALHDKSAAFTARVHLSYLIQAVAGTQSSNFSRLLVGRDQIEGPYVGERKSTLPTTYAMTFVFQSRHTHRTVDVLALDEQTFRCWMIVMSYFAGINSGEGSQPVPEDVGTLAPDTPRSQSVASQW